MTQRVHERAIPRNNNRTRTIQKPTRAVDTDKVAKLVRMLASNHDGEVIASVVALRRTLGAAGLDLHDLADAAVAGLQPRSTAKQHSHRTSWEPPPPDCDNWESMSWWLRYNSRYLHDDDRDYVIRALLGRTGFDLGRATPELMRRLRNLIAKVEAARSAEDRW
jgi:hypothetical protein